MRTSSQVEKREEERDHGRDKGRKSSQALRRKRTTRALLVRKQSQREKD